MTAHFIKPISIRIHQFISALILITCFLIFIGCSATKTVVDTTTETIKRTTRTITRKITLSDEDLKRRVGIFDFENKSLRESWDFQKIFHKGLPEYMNSNCQGIIVAGPGTGELLNPLKEPPRLKSGRIDNFALAVIGRQLGLNAIVTGSLEDIRITNELEGILWTKDTHYFVQMFVRVEVYDTWTATKILDDTFDRRIEIDDFEYRMILESEKLKLPQLNETLKQLLIDIGDNICDTVRDQPWNGFIIKIEEDKFIISSGTQVGLKLGDILEVYDSSRIIEGVDEQRFFTPGLKTGEIEIVAVSENRLEARLVSGEDIKKGSTVRRK